MNPESSRRLILGFAIFAAFFFLAAVWFHPWLALGVLFLSHSLILFPTLVGNCQWLGPVVTRFETPLREVWVTIDDGPHPGHTLRMLEILDRLEARATFFVIGEKAKQFPGLMEAIRAAGHEVANHSTTHPSATFWCLSPRRIAEEIDRSPVSGSYFRAPVGMKNPFVHPALRRRGMRLIGWTVRGLDTVKSDAEAVASRLCRGARPGAILVLHEGHHLDHPEFHPRCLELTLRALTTKGYRCVLPKPEQLRTRAGEKQKDGY